MNCAGAQAGLGGKGSMMLTTKAEGLRRILQEAREQFIQLALCNPAGQWSKEYYSIDHIKENRRGFENSTIIVLRSEKDSSCQMFDINLITALKFNKYLQHQGALVNEVNVVKKEAVETFKAVELTGHV